MASDKRQASEGLGGARAAPLATSRAVICVLSLVLLFGAGHLDSAITFYPPLFRFTSKLMFALGAANNSTNLVVSPLSLHMALNVLLLGTDEGSKTMGELKRALGYGWRTRSEDVYLCHLDYRKLLRGWPLWVSRRRRRRRRLRAAAGADDKNGGSSFNRQHRRPTMDPLNMIITHNQAAARNKYKSDIAEYFNSSIENIDDQKPETLRQTLGKLNAWSKGAKFSKPLVNESDFRDPKLQTVLLSALNFQATWLEVFEQIKPGHKSHRPFYSHGLSDKPVNCTMLENVRPHGIKFKGFSIRTLNKIEDYLAKLKFRAIDLPMPGHLSFVIFEPLRFSTPESDELNKLVLGLFGSNEELSPQVTVVEYALIMLASMKSDNYRLQMPEFKFESALALNKTLMAMGVRRAFSEKDTDIEWITKKALHVDRVEHMAMVDVNKDGIKSPGPSGHKILYTPIPSLPPIEVVIERPFVFLVRYKGFPVLVGQVVSP